MSHLTRGPILWMGIGGKAITDGRRHDYLCISRHLKEVMA